MKGHVIYGECCFSDEHLILICFVVCLLTKWSLSVSLKYLHRPNSITINQVCCE